VQYEGGSGPLHGSHHGGTSSVPNSPPEHG
jgi:hypothetical protein